ncbi:MAG: PepSY domain-containing protein [Calditrichaceae bacterium]
MNKDIEKNTMKRIFKKSKWLHKYIGIILILFLAWMSLSGIILNHPDLISGFSVSSEFVPAQYRINNWNRSSLRQLIFSGQNPSVGFAAGKQGVWKTDDGGITFYPLNDGFPESQYYRKTNHIFLIEQKSIPPVLFAGTDNGLYAANPADEKWKNIKLGGKTERVLKIIKKDLNLIVFTDSEVYISPVNQNFEFKQVHLQRFEDAHQVSLVKLFFDLHDGNVWGLPGKIFFDLIGLLLFFLSLSSLYTWYFKLRQKYHRTGMRTTANKRLLSVYRFLFKYHLKLGIWSAVFLLMIGITAFFMRPPFIAAIAEGTIAAELYPGLLSENPWEGKIQNALYDSVDDQIIIQCSDGLWLGKPDFSEPLVKKDFPFPIFVMGATVFEVMDNGDFLVGSFNGIYRMNRETGEIRDLLTGNGPGGVTSVRPAEYMITGYFRTPSGDEFITAHEQGLVPVGSSRSDGRFIMPDEINESFRMPLWNYMFELHNGRIFKDLIGGWYILIAPVGSLLFVLIILTGVFDWFYLKVYQKRKMTGKISRQIPTRHKDKANIPENSGKKPGDIDKFLIPNERIYYE